MRLGPGRRPPGRGLPRIGLALVNGELKRDRVDGGQRIALGDGLVVGDMEGDDPTGDLGSDGYQVGLDIGIGGIGDERCGDLIQREEAEDCCQGDDDSPLAGDGLCGGSMLMVGMPAVLANGGPRFVEWG